MEQHIFSDSGFDLLLTVDSDEALIIKGQNKNTLKYYETKWRNQEILQLTNNQLNSIEIFQNIKLGFLKQNESILLEIDDQAIIHLIIHYMVGGIKKEQKWAFQLTQIQLNLEDQLKEQTIRMKVLEFENEDLKKQVNEAKQITSMLKQIVQQLNQQNQLIQQQGQTISLLQQDLQELKVNVHNPITNDQQNQIIQDEINMIKQEFQITKVINQQSTIQPQMSQNQQNSGAYRIENEGRKITKISGSSNHFIPSKEPLPRSGKIILTLLLAKLSFQWFIGFSSDTSQRIFDNKGSKWIVFRSPSKFEIYQANKQLEIFETGIENCVEGSILKLIYDPEEQWFRILFSNGNCTKLFQLDNNFKQKDVYPIIDLYHKDNCVIWI